MNEIIIGAIDMSPYFERRGGAKYVFRGVPFETIKHLRLIVDNPSYNPNFLGAAVRIKLYEKKYHGNSWEQMGWIGSSTITWKCQGMFYFNMVFYRRGVNFDNLKWELWHE